MDWQTVFAIVGALTGITAAVSSFRTSRSSARKTDIESLQIIIETQAATIEQQNKAIEKLKKDHKEQMAALCKRIECLEEENKQLRDDNRSLTGQLSRKLNGLREDKLT